MEHRKSVRYDLSLPTRITVRPANEPLSGSTTNVSNGGAFVRVDSQIPVGSPLSLELDLGMNRLMRLIGEHEKRVTVSVEGTVVRHDTCGVGVAFGRRYSFVAV